MSESKAEAARLRRRLVPVVDPRFQWKYTMIVSGLGVSLTVIMGFFLYRAHQANTRLLDLGGNQFLAEQVERGDQVFMMWLAGLVITMALMLTVWGLIVTHRISGPLFLVGRYLRTLADGRHPDMRPLRKRDELQNFFQTFAETLARLRQRDEALLKDLQALSSATGKDDGSMKKAMDRLSEQQQLLEKSLGDMAPIDAD